MPDAARAAAATVCGKRQRGSKLTLWRRLSQFMGILIIGQWSYYGVFRCPFIVPYVSCQNCPVITCHGRIFTLFWGFWLLLPVSALLFGRAFCGWACPGGLVNQMAAKLVPLKFKLQSTLFSFARYGKYVGVLLIVYIWLVLGQPREAVPIRVGDFFASTRLTFEHAEISWLIRTFFVLGVVAAGLFLANAWCRFACPTGGVLDVLKRFTIFRIYKTAECNGCNSCEQVCEMETRPDESDCTNCGDCLTICPQGAIRMGTKGKTPT
ncbi:MAG: 4Fe-4S binding protein [Desulfobacterales bacterium]|nr:4Fe-4S binding protein [Desulfobacterales bacterium]